VAETFREQCPGLSVDLLPGATDERDLIGWASKAAGTLSMSFHGCVMSMIAGRPAVPVVAGDYYIHKYRDFDRYCGNQGIPVVALDEATDEPSLERLSTKVIDYFKRFDVSRAIGARLKASEQMGAWYHSIAQALH
jgi:hypothetical protein